MRRAILTLALLPSLALAQAVDAPATCNPGINDAWGYNSGQLWATWQCRSAAGSTQRYWDRFYLVFEPKSAPAGVGAVFDKWRKGDATALSEGNKLRTDSLDSAKFSATYKVAQAAAAKQAPIATRADIVTGKACACDIRHVDNGYLWRCPLAPVAPSTTPGPLADCKPL